jgi:hypothetical protein
LGYLSAANVCFTLSHLLACFLSSSFTGCDTGSGWGIIASVILGYVKLSLSRKKILLEVRGKSIRGHI